MHQSLILSYSGASTIIPSAAPFHNIKISSLQTLFGGISRNLQMLLVACLRRTTIVKNNNLGHYLQHNSCDKADFSHSVCTVDFPGVNSGKHGAMVFILGESSWVIRKWWFERSSNPNSRGDQSGFSLKMIPTSSSFLSLTQEMMQLMSSIWIQEVWAWGREMHWRWSGWIKPAQAQSSVVWWTLEVWWRCGGSAYWHSWHQVGTTVVVQAGPDWTGFQVVLPAGDLRVQVIPLSRGSSDHGWEWRSNKCGHAAVSES